jgi:hypothetical protein
VFKYKITNTKAFSSTNIQLQNKMNRRILTDTQRNLLLHCLQQYKPELLVKVPDLYVIKPDKELVSSMIIAVAQELMAKGFLGDEKSKEYGEELEQLINGILAIRRS